MEKRSGLTLMLGIPFILLLIVNYIDSAVFEISESAYAAFTIAGLVSLLIILIRIPVIFIRHIRSKKTVYEEEGLKDAIIEHMEQLISGNRELTDIEINSDVVQLINSDFRLVVHTLKNRDSVTKYFKNKKCRSLDDELGTVTEEETSFSLGTDPKKATDILLGFLKENYDIRKGVLIK